MRNLLLLIVLFFSTSVFAEQKWIEWPEPTLADLIQQTQIIDKYTFDNKRYYLLKPTPLEATDPLILCTVTLNLRSPITRCYWEEKNAFVGERSQ